MMYCEHCQIEYPEGKKFCRQCGESLKPTVTTLAGEATNCPNCGKSIVPTAKFCGGCGISLMGSTPVSFARVQATASPTAKQIDAAALEEAIRQQRKKILKAAGIGIGGLGLLGAVIVSGIFAYRAFMLPPFSPPQEQSTQITQELLPQAQLAQTTQPTPPSEGEIPEVSKLTTGPEIAGEGNQKAASSDAPAGESTPSGERDSITPEVIGPEAVWNPPQPVWGRMQDECRKYEKSQFVECVVSIMRESSAPPQAIAFTKLIKGEGYIDSFREIGTVDLVSVFYPFRANDNGNLLLVNGTPRIVDLEDSQKLKNVDIRKEQLYRSLVRKFPKLELWGHAEFETVQQLSAGGQRFVFSFILLNGCHACEVGGHAHIAYDFDKAGKFLGTKLLRLSEERSARIVQEEQQPRREMTTPPPLSPGWYEVVRSTPLLEEPHRDAAIITRLPLKKRVYVVSATGDYVRVESTRGKPPGYISRKDLVPARGGKEAVRLEEQSRREEERQQRLQAQEEAGRQAEVARQAEIQRREDERRQQQEWQQQQELLRRGGQILQGLGR